MKTKLVLGCALVLFAVAVSLLTTLRARVSAEGASKVVLGARTFSIPKENLLEAALPGWLRRFPGLDDGSRSFLVKFPASELAEGVPDYRVSDGNYREDIFGVLSALTAEEERRYATSEQLADLWHRRDSYRDAVIEPYTIPGWHKVYRKIEYPYSWALLKYLPPAEQPIPPSSEGFWVAQCLEGGSTVTASKRHVACKSFVQFDDVAVDFEMSEQNVKHIDQIRAFIKAQVLEWKQP